MSGRLRPPTQNSIPPSPAVATIRWGVVIVGLLFAAVTSSDSHLMFVFGSTLLAHALWRTARPAPRDLAATVVAVINEVALTVVVIAVTGWFESPYVVTLIAPIAAAAHARATIRAIEDRQALALDQLSHLTEANMLLGELQTVTRALPTSLDLGDAVTTTVSQLRAMFDPNAVALLLHDDAADTWTVVSAVGARLPRSMTEPQLPGALRDALSSHHVLLVDDLGHSSSGISTTSSIGMYAALRARDRVVGLIAVERVVPGALGQRDCTLLDGFLERAAMAIDNARIFGRLRRIGADEERTRIARDLHDRVGQGLAYLSFELDRIGGQAGDPVQTEIAALRSDVKQILGEVRETLSDIRTDVSESQDLVGTVDAFITRVERRSDIRFEFEHDGRERLPLPVEREMWRIAQEALANAERHSGASMVRIRWRCADHKALLEVSDDGAGMHNTFPLKPGSFGLLGMRERADAIGAALEIESEVGHGTTVRCMLDSQ
jgi:signal transduction histidine kinase